MCNSQQCYYHYVPYSKDRKNKKFHESKGDLWKCIKSVSLKIAWTLDTETWHLTYVKCQFDKLGHMLMNYEKK